MKYLVTGGAGLIGSHLAGELLRYGHEVTILDRFTSGSSENIAHLVYHEGLKIVPDDVRYFDVVRKLVEPMDGVFHLAAVLGYRHVMEDPIAVASSGFHGTSNVLEAARTNHTRILFTSTSELYGEYRGAPFKETDTPQVGRTDILSHIYQWTKGLEECLCFAYASQHAVPVTVARVFNTIGPGQSADAGFVVPTFVKSALRGEPMVMHGDGTQSRTFSHVTDTVAALIELMDSDRSIGQLVNVGGTETVTIGELAQLVAETIGRPCVVRKEKQPYGNSYENVHGRKPDLSKLIELTGHVQTVPLREAVRDVVKHYQMENAA